MGEVTRNKTIALRWAEQCNEPTFHDRPAKIELNGREVIEMNPATHRHGIKQAAPSNTLRQQLPEGTTFVECSVATTDGVRVMRVIGVIGVIRVLDKARD